MPVVVETFELPKEEITTTNKVFSLRFLTGEVHKVNNILLQDIIVETLKINCDDFISLYKLIGSGNTFFLELESDAPCEFSHKDFRTSNGLHFTVEDSSAPRTTIKLEGVPFGTSDISIKKCFEKYLIENSSIEDIKVITTKNNRGDQRIVVLPLKKDANVPDYIRFENRQAGYQQPALVIVPGRKQKCLHCGSTTHFTFSVRCPTRAKRAEVRPRVFLSKKDDPENIPSLMSIDTSQTPQALATPPPKNGTCLGLTQVSQDTEDTPSDSNTESGSESDVVESSVTPTVDSASISTPDPTPDPSLDSAPPPSASADTSPDVADSSTRETTPDPAPV